MVTVGVHPYVGIEIVCLPIGFTAITEHCGPELFAMGISLINALVVLVMALYVIDHMLFALHFALKTYFQKIADPADIAATSGISFTINHIAAVILPVLLGFVWVVNHSAVFLVGAAIACSSLVLSQLIPDNPQPEFETRLSASI